MLDLRLVADTFNHEHQSRSSEESAEVLASLARRIAGTIDDPRERAMFVDIATMSGLRVELGENRCAQCGVAFDQHPAGDGVTECPGDFPGDDGHPDWPYV